MFRALSSIISSAVVRSLAPPGLARFASPAMNNPGERVLAIALGSNLGDKVRNIETALRMLETQHGVRVIDTSFLYESHPMYVKDQPSFINGACLVSNFVRKFQCVYKRFVCKKDFNNHGHSTSTGSAQRH
jgi:hypothetical protein